MADRLKSLQRIAAVQSQMVRLSEWRLAISEQACRQLTEDQARLQGYVVKEGALGVTLAKSALRSLHRLDRRRSEAEHARDACRAALDSSKRRESAICDLTAEVAKATRRVNEDRDLAMTVEAWLARKSTSLP